MADRTIAERLQPSLLDRLTDAAPGELKERRDDRVIDVRALREIILRDLSWLLNTNNLEATHDLEEYPHAQNSVINYGVADISGQGATQDRALDMRRMIRLAIERFEPRILPGSLEVEYHAEAEGAGAVITFDIRGEMWAQPLPLDLYMRTAVDVTTGELKIDRSG